MGEDSLEEADAGPRGADGACEEGSCAENFAGEAVELGGGVREKFAVFGESEEAIDDGEEFGHRGEGGEDVVGEGAGAGWVG